MSEDAPAKGRIASWEDRHRRAVVRGSLLALLLIAAVVLFLVLRSALSTPFNPYDPGFPVGSISETDSHQIARLDSVAEALDPHSGVMVVNCWSQHDWARFEAWLQAHGYESFDVLGETVFATKQIQLSPFVCRLLARALARPAQQQPLVTAFALDVLAHESAHAAGIQAENLAECRAIETLPRAAQLFGIPKGFALRLQHLYRGSSYPGLPRPYRTPPCKAGLPGAVAPYALGAAADLRSLKRTANAVARDLPSWRDIGGGPIIDTPSPCRLVESRTSELASFGDAFRGPHGESVLYTGVRTRTRSEFAAALRRDAAMPRCELAQLGSYVAGYQSSGAVRNGRMPDSITRLSPQVRAFREVYLANGHTRNRDYIFVFDPTQRTYEEVSVDAFARGFPVSVEQRVTEAILHASHQRG